MNTGVFSVKRPIYDALNTYVMPLVFRGHQLDVYYKGSISAAVTICMGYLLYFKVMQPPLPLRHLPRANWFFSNKAYIQKTVYDYAREVSLPLALQSSKGMYVRLEPLGWAIHIARPEAAKQLLNNPDLFPKAKLFKSSRETLESRLGHNNILFLNGSKWKSQRMIVNPAFHRSMPLDVFGRMTIKLFGVIDNDLDHDDVEIRDLTGRLTLDSIGLGGFGFDFDSITDKNSEWASRYNSTCGEVHNPFFLVFPIFDTLLLPLFPGRRKTHQELKKFVDMVDEIVVDNKRRVLSREKELMNKANDHEKDLLTLIIEAEEDGSGALSNEELRSNLIIFLGAGHETTANAIATTIYHLAANQEIQSRAREQVLEVLGHVNKDVIPTTEQLREMSYNNMIIKEAMRINPSAVISFPRIASQDTELEGTIIPKGTPVYVDMFELHHNPTVWKDPDTFNPERFVPGGEADQIGSSAWLPFLRGPRQCVGMNFSLAEQRVFLSMFLRKYEFKLPSDTIHKEKLITTGRIIAGPKDLKIIVRRRY